jgi:hypothetical protein
MEAAAQKNRENRRSLSTILPPVILNVLRKL